MSLSLPPGVWDALQRSSDHKSYSKKLFSDFEGGLNDVISTTGEQSTNLHDLVCPRSGCGSIILKNGVAKFVERDSLQIEPTDATHPSLPPLPSPPSTSQWWLVTPSPMQFENIGFSRPVETLALSPSGKKLKLLACAECDLGPLGWSEEGGNEFWLACTRIGYRVGA